jgi:hypothetical protein
VLGSGYCWCLPGICVDGRAAPDAGTWYGTYLTYAARYDRAIGGCAAAASRSLCHRRAQPFSHLSRPEKFPNFVFAVWLT